MDTTASYRRKQNTVSSFTQHIGTTSNLLSPFERVLFGFLLMVFVISGGVLLHRVNSQFLVSVPSDGGVLVEGVVGSPRFINPLLSITNADSDLTTLVYSGLMRATPDGSLIPDVAERYTVSEDGLVYHFTIRQDAIFHDHEPVTADDVVFTVNKAKDPALKSPRRASWDGVVVEKINEREVVFRLEQPYTPFLFNTTIGILPEHVWSEADSEEFAFSQFNTEPIGSGPYKIRRISRDRSGIPEFYELQSFDDYVLGKPHISKIFLHFYANEDRLIDAYLDNEITSINNLSKNGLALVGLNRKTFNVKRSPLPRIFGVFFNQNQKVVLTHQEVREALAISLNKQRLVNEVLGGNGVALDGPLPPGVLAPDTPSPKTGDKKAAIELLEKNGWEVNETTGMWERETDNGTDVLQFSLATSDVPELRQAASLIVSEWGEIGIPVDLQIFSAGDLNQTVIRPRRYDALFFGEIIGRELDLYAFWHSSQRNDPGLNIALYANITTDALLETVRTTRNEQELTEKFQEFEAEIKSDVPAVFIYAPDFLYLIPESVQGVDIRSVTAPHERFINVHTWYINTDQVWKFLTTI